MSLLPPRIREFIRTEGLAVPGSDAACEGAQFHSPRPLVTRLVRLVPEDWGVPGSPEVYLCGTCAANLRVLTEMLHATDGELAWPIRREFGNDLRALGMQAWEWYAEARPAEPPTLPTKG